MMDYLAPLQTRDLLVTKTMAVVIRRIRDESFCFRALETVNFVCSFLLNYCDLSQNMILVFFVESSFFHVIVIRSLFTQLSWP